MKAAFAVIAGLGLLSLGVTDLDLRSLRDYTKWKQVTPGPVDMSPHIARLCAGPPAVDQQPNPHVPKVFRVFVNSLGERAFAKPSKIPFPVGTMIVKEKFSRNGKESWEPVRIKPGTRPELLTAMIKRKAGFDPKNGDWEYVVLSGDARMATTKDLGYCRSCHQGQRANGFVFGNYAKYESLKFRGQPTPSTGE